VQKNISRHQVEMLFIKEKPKIEKSQETSVSKCRPQIKDPSGQNEESYA